ncbi:MAG: hypothetical protein AAFR00_13200 [Pseudomonadota bacterium]
MTLWLARIGAALFGLWGLLHILAAISVLELAQTLEAGIVQGRLFQDAVFLLFFAVLAIVTAYWNAKNSPKAYAINLIGTSVSDIPFILFLVLPGYIPPPTNFVGPALWLAAILLSGTALWMRSKTSAEAAPDLGAQ